MTDYTVTLTPNLVDPVTEGSLDSSVINGKSVQRTMNGIFVINNDEKKMVGRLNDRSTFNNTIERLNNYLNVSMGLKTFTLTYDGSSFGNNATATATITLNLDAISDFGNTDVSSELPGVITQLELTVSNASDGNGTFTANDFHSFFWWTGGRTLYFDKEVIGQPTSNLPWGTPDGYSGDFNLFSNNPSAPDGLFFFILATSGGFGDLMLLTNFVPN